MRGGILIGLLIFPLALFAQEKEASKTDLGGYFKNLQQLYFFNDSWPGPGFVPTDTFFQDNLLHSRLNFDYEPLDGLNFVAELRTRVFYGELVKATPAFGTMIENADNDYFDLSVLILDQNSWVIHSMLDRLYLEYYSDKWEIRLGRQRVNWGIGTVWNPNDIFNAFNFADYDYEERPGSDVLRVKYFTGFASHLELVIRPADRLRSASAAGLWKFHLGQYDLQLIGGYNKEDLVLGGGWAGNLGDAGLKGELTWFRSTTRPEDHAFSATGSLDYSFENSLYLQAGYLYNSEGASSAAAGAILDYELSARNLYPYRHAVLVQGAYSFTPLLNANFTSVYSPVESHALFLFPVLTYSMAEDWDLDFIAQIVFEQRDEYSSPVQALSLRFRFDF